MGNKSSRASEGGGHGKAGVKHKIKKLKSQMAKAVSEERYEEAGLIRDEIVRLQERESQS